MVITEIIKLGKSKNCLIIPKFEMRKLCWAENQEVVIRENEDKTGLIIEPA